MRLMSTIQLKCNGCGTVRQGLPGRRVSALRRALSEIGWKNDPAANVDLCGTCVEKASVAS